MTYKCGTLLGRIMKRDGTVIQANTLGTTGTNVDVSEYLLMTAMSGQNTSFSFSLS